MPTQVGVSLRAAGRIHYYETGDLELTVGDCVVVGTARGLELGQVVSFRERAAEPEAAERGGRVLRLAQDDDLQQFSRGRLRALEALEVARERIKHHDLPMKLLDAETTLDGSKLVLYFDSESRVDFRSLVRDLAATLHKRIELHQVGARDRSALTGGLGPCGRECCCSSWTRELYPVSIKMAKEQSLSLNPTKISGSCGRLMCCLRYEYQAYRDLRREMPRIGEVITVTQGEVRVVAVYPMRSTLKVEHPELGILEIPSPRTREPAEGLPAQESAAPAQVLSEVERPPRPRRVDASHRPSGRSGSPEDPGPSTGSKPRTSGRKPRTTEGGSPRSSERPRRGRESGPARPRSEKSSGQERPAVEKGPVDEATRGDAAAPESGRSPRAERKRPRRNPKRPRRVDSEPVGQGPAAEPSGSAAAQAPGRPRRKGRGRRPARRRSQPPDSGQP